MTEQLVTLVVAVITLTGVGLTAVVTWLIAQRRIAVEHVTAERAKWREKIRTQALLVHDAILCGNAAAVVRLKCEFRALLNPFDPEDHKLLECMKVDESPNAHKTTAEDFTRQVSLLLKHDWDRAKLEAGFFLGRWTLDAKRWGLDWALGKSGERRAREGLRWYEKHKVRPVRTTVLLIVILGVGLIACLAVGLLAAGG